MLTITKQHINKMITHSREEAPAEACGLLAGKGDEVTKLFPMTNIEQSSKRYLIDPKEQFAVFKQIRNEDLELLGIYHSHVATEAYPSQTDCKMAVYDVAYLIVSLQTKEPVIKAFIIKEGKVEEQKYKIVDG